MITGDNEAAARALAELPAWMTDEARARVDRFRRKKLHSPLTWSDPKWADTCAALASLAAEFPDEGEALATSPVADF